MKPNQLTGLFFCIVTAFLLGCGNPKTPVSTEAKPVISKNNCLNVDLVKYAHLSKQVAEIEAEIKRDPTQNCNLLKQTLAVANNSLYSLRAASGPDCIGCEDTRPPEPPKPKCCTLEGVEEECPPGTLVGSKCHDKFDCAISKYPLEDLFVMDKSGKRMGSIDKSKESYNAYQYYEYPIIWNEDPKDNPFSIQMTQGKSRATLQKYMANGRFK